MEQWRLIDEFDNYEVSSHGRVRNNVRGKILSSGMSSCGYFIVVLSKDGHKKTHTVHRLVAFAFCLNPNGYDVVDHIDKSRINNMFNNLRWCTSSENNRNTTKSKRNTSGNKGVVKHGNSWQARWCDNECKQKSKNFSIVKFGDDEAKTLAIEFRKARELEFGYV